jgi:hypothetical protein
MSEGRPLRGSRSVEVGENSDEDDHGGVALVGLGTERVLVNDVNLGRM